MKGFPFAQLLEMMRLKVHYGIPGPEGVRSDSFLGINENESCIVLNIISKIDYRIWHILKCFLESVQILVEWKVKVFEKIVERRVFAGATWF
jgi:hypothetical protein